MNRIIANITLFLSLINLSAGAVSIGKMGRVSIDYRSKSAASIIMSISLENIDLKSIEYNGEIYTDIRVGGTANYHLIGQPQLPVIRKMIRLPLNGKIDCELTVHSEEYLDLSKNGFHRPLLPAQPYRRKTDGGFRPIRIDRQIYDKDSYYSLGPVKVNQEFSIGGIRGIMLDYFPISYNPVQNTLKIITKATIVISIAEEQNLQKRTADVFPINPAFEQMADRLFVNNDMSAFSVKSETAETFLVISGDKFADDDVLRSYLNWKRQCGFRIIQKSLSDVGGSASAIKEYIVNRYHSENPPTYVLFIGDVADVPAWHGSASDSESDAPYSRMDDDFFPDVMVGRFSVTDSADLHAVIRKSLAYEKCGNEDLSAYNKITFIATDEEESDCWQLVESTHNYVIDTYLTDRGVYTDHIKAHSGGSTADIFQALNDGRTICHYSGHGLETEWQGPSFDRINITRLIPGKIPSLVISNACLTGSFSKAECFGETWIRTDNRGAFAFIGASNSSYWEPDDYMERGMYDAYFSEGQKTTGAMLYSGLLNVYSRTYNAGDDQTYKYYFDIYNLLGDPSIKARIGIPKETYADYQNRLTLLSRNFPVTVMNESEFVENALVTLVQDTNLIARGITGSDGRTSLSIASSSVAIGDLILTITADHQIPFVDVIKVTNPVDIVLEPDTIPVAGTADVFLSVKDDNSDPLSDLAVYASGWSFRRDSLLGMTDSNGQLQFQLKPRYGEAVTVFGINSDEPGYVFIDTLTVTGAGQLSNPEITASVYPFNIENYLVPEYAGIISGTADESDVLLALRGDGIDTVSACGEVEVIPDAVGTLKAALLKAGSSVYEKTFSVKEAFGTVRFKIVDMKDSALANVTISGYRYPDTLDILFQGRTDSSGIFEYSEQLPVGYYRFRANLFGYQPEVVLDTVKLGSNICFFKMEASPRYRLTGYVTGGVNNRPLDAGITVYEFSSGVGEEFTTIQTFAEKGGIFQIECPAGEYEFLVSSLRYISKTYSETITNQPGEYHFHLDTTKASILLIDDDSGKRAITKSDYYVIDEKSGKSKSAAEICHLLESGGYYVCRMDYSSGLKESFRNYDMLISSSGSNIEPISSSAYRLALEDYVAGGGVLLIEGGEVGYDATTEPGYYDFAGNVLHVTGWNGDDTGPLYRLQAEHDLVKTPHSLPFQIDFDYYGFGDEDACTPTADADIVYFNNDDVNDAGVILYENPDYNIGGVTLFYSFAFDKIADPDVGKNLLENSVHYLLLKKNYSKGDINRDQTVDILDLMKVVNLILEIDQPGDDFERWAADLNGDDAINILDLVWVINIILGREGFGKPAGAENTPVQLAVQNEALSFQSNSPVAALQIEFTPDASFQVDPDLTSTHKVSARQQGNKLILYRLSKSGILPEKAKLGHLNNGGKILRASAVDIGGKEVETVLNRLPTEFRLYQNYPNPFNAETLIRFDLPQESHVILEIFDLLGRKVTTLLNEKRQPGTYRLQWNGLDGKGREMATGIYFYSIQTDNFQYLRKMALVK
ncbi:MAG: T9SS type A sorting domain-containing protein [Candidatus Marinimicrobia bacterium]|nr:T9SS type A sorting domain-containing protein [Candidatus Neomarinimicrobiota bacterium]